MTLGSNYGAPLIPGVSGRLVGSAYAIDGFMGDSFNTGFAIFQPDAALLTTNLPSGSGMDINNNPYPSITTSVPYVTFTISHQAGDSFGLTVGYIYCTNCSTNCLQVDCPTNKTIPCGVTNWTFDLPTATSCCTNQFYNSTGPGTNVQITSLGITTNDQCPQAVIYTETWLITDGCGNTNSCSQSVSVECCQTNTGCINLTCPSNIVASTCSNCVPVFYSATATDCCSNVAMITYNPPSGTCFGLGTTLVQVTAYACGFITNCSFAVTVNQATSGGANCLQVQCPNNMVVKCGSSWQFVPPTATSCCSNLVQHRNRQLDECAYHIDGLCDQRELPAIEHHRKLADYRRLLRQHELQPDGDGSGRAAANGQLPEQYRSYKLHQCGHILHANGD